MKLKFTLQFILFFWIESMCGSPATISENIKVDQFGYRPLDEKIAVISNPIIGYNDTATFIPGSVYQLREWSTDAVVFTGSPASWNSGATQSQSGDQVWWFDFSTFTSPGVYYVFDVSNNVGSYRFEIDECIYNNALVQTVRMFYYSRCGARKLAQHAGAGWADNSCHKMTDQDDDCKLYNNRISSTSKDLTGGWHDAGDYNKYVNFAWGTLIDLLLAYEENPLIWGDDYNIPESGNGIPDLLDEIKYELSWLRKMQQTDGSVLSIVGGGAASPPSSDQNFRVYGPATTSASFTAAGVFALASIQFASIGQTFDAFYYKNAALAAYDWAVANPGITFYNSGLLGAGEQETDNYGLAARKFTAAVFLYALTTDQQYRTFVDANYQDLHLLQWIYAYPFEGVEQDALLYYTKTPGATTSVINDIISAYTSSMVSNNADNLPAYLSRTDAYSAWLADNNYTWNSNQTKSKQANMYLNMNVYNLSTVNQNNFTNAAAGYVHYFHGVNPNSKTFISNMGSFGAENSVSQFYHAWFENGSPLWDEVGVSTYGPPPGYIPGGPNPGYSLDGCCPGSCGSPINNALCNINVTPPMNQPIQKSYKDFNDNWPLNSWTVTEAGIYTNAAYVKMISKFASPLCLPTTISALDLSGKEKIIKSIFPSPSKNVVTIIFNRMLSEEKISLFDISGRIVFVRSIENENSMQIDLSGLTSGIYVLKVNSGETIEVARIVKQ
ncbi:MAG: glycoside hydrolase family 9 protein [Bacteroidota bacterium]|nr:glycoside hydrolase family 9 protein [Bacteroidota bacterium]